MGPLGVPRWAALQPGRDAVVIDGIRHSFGELYANASRGAQLLADLGVGAGARVGLAMRNRIEYLEINLAAWLCEAVMVPFAYRSTSDELDYLVEDAGMSVLFVEDDGARTFDICADRYVARIGRGASALTSSLAPSADAGATGRAGYSRTPRGPQGGRSHYGVRIRQDGSSVHDPGSWLQQFPVATSPPGYIYAWRRCTTRSRGCSPMPHWIGDTRW